MGDRLPQACPPIETPSRWRRLLGSNHGGIATPEAPCRLKKTALVMKVFALFKGLLGGMVKMRMWARNRLSDLAPGVAAPASCPALQRVALPGCVSIDNCGGLTPILEATCCAGGTRIHVAGWLIVISSVWPVAGGVEGLAAIVSRCKIHSSLHPETVGCLGT